MSVSDHIGMYACSLVLEVKSWSDSFGDSLQGGLIWKSGQAFSWHAQ
jgi:hypothetical protein